MTRCMGPLRYAALLIGAALLLVIAWSPGTTLADPSQSESEKRPFTEEFPLGDCTWVTEDDSVLSPGNPLFPMVPGSWLLLEGEGKDGELVLQITVCLDDGSNCTTNDGTNVPGVHVTIPGVPTRVIEEREWEDGELVEISHNYFSRCEETNAIFYWGEAVEDIEDGMVVGNGGAWEAGVDGAQPGVIMPGMYLLGARYFQEMAPDIALDRAENAEMNLEIEVDLMGAGPTVLEGCVRIFETSDLASGDRSTKVYCPGVGLAIDDDAELVDRGP